MPNFIFIGSIGNPRFWLLFAALSTRGVGFLISLLISRMAGPTALGGYSALVNTASSVATPFEYVMANNATLMGAQSAQRGMGSYWTLALASFIFATVLAVASVGVFIFLYCFVLDSGESSVFILLMVTGTCAVFGQIVGAVSMGFLYGVDEFVFASRLAILMAVVVTLAAYPAISGYGFRGALVLLIVFSLASPLLGGLRVLTCIRSPSAAAAPNRQIWREVGLRFVRSLPTVAALTVNNGVNWVCTIYLVQTWYGAAGVGVVAVAGQWLNLMLIPVTSWGSLTLRALTDAVTTRNAPTIWYTSAGLVRKNIVVTLGLAGLIALASGTIEQAYGLSSTDVGLLICINGGYAVVASINNVFERLLLALDRQDWWLAVSIVSLSLQLTISLLFIEHGLWVVALGVLLNGVALCLLSLVTVNRIITIQMKE